MTAIRQETASAQAELAVEALHDLGQLAIAPPRTPLTLVPPLEVPQFSPGEEVFSGIAHLLDDENAFPFHTERIDLSGRDGEMGRMMSGRRDGLRSAQSLSAQVAVAAWDPHGYASHQYR